MRASILILLLFISGLLNSQNKTIAAGEKLVFTASYNMSGILTDLAEVTMQTSEVKTSKATLMQLKCTAVTYSKWDSFFKIRDLYESYVSPNYLTPYLYKRDIDEGGYYKFMQYNFNQKTNTVHSLMRKKNSKGEFWEEKKTLTIGSNTRDLVTTLYQIRNLDIGKAKVNDTSQFTILFDNKEFTINVKMLGKETISTALGRKECFKLGISLPKNNELGKNTDFILWLTADANKIPVYGKFKIPVGNGELKIKSATGLMHKI
ncbi:DUF3108 domain-containing protein [Paucihalobacter sp.]|uniref:DUF3108 domain-containing protein n=1 Tax=Paucihalobacter sp. TaxID=2850405 RepID=UPI002FE10377